ncbi:hypothetical protein OIU77_004541 [Salix suchowensis]|uniref:Uncharacterized protein n=1 Tax=Salix suchowensis TaxID=1278906 RepID=A0ABQ9AWC5_9ROSI|nr:hypothetical protein OIU77_004541 [Salix suchowensis]
MSMVSLKCHCLALWVLINISIVCSDNTCLIIYFNSDINNTLNSLKGASVMLNASSMLVQQSGDLFPLSFKPMQQY